MLQAAIAHTNLEDKVSKKDVARLSGLPAQLECLDPAKPDEADLKVRVVVGSAGAGAVTTRQQCAHSY